MRRIRLLSLMIFIVLMVTTFILIHWLPDLQSFQTQSYKESQPYEESQSYPIQSNDARQPYPIQSNDALTTLEESWWNECDAMQQSGSISINDCYEKLPKPNIPIAILFWQMKDPYDALLKAFNSIPIADKDRFQLIVPIEGYDESYWNKMRRTFSFYIAKKRLLLISSVPVDSIIQSHCQDHEIFAIAGSEHEISESTWNSLESLKFHKSKCLQAESRTVLMFKQDKWMKRLLRLPLFKQFIVLS